MCEKRDETQAKTKSNLCNSWQEKRKNNWKNSWILLKKLRRIRKTKTNWKKGNQRDFRPYRETTTTRMGINETHSGWSKQEVQKERAMNYSGL